MKSTKTAEWTTDDGRHIKIVVDYTKSVSDDISYADGWNINHGKKTYEGVEIKLSVNGVAIFSRCAPTPITKITCTDYDKLTKQGVYATLGDKLISKKPYDAIMSMIADAAAECATPEFEAVKAAEAAKEAAKEAAWDKLYDDQQKLIDGGLCPKCGSYCYGDCTAH